MKNDYGFFDGCVSMIYLIGIIVTLFSLAISFFSIFMRDNSYFIERNYVVIFLLIILFVVINAIVIFFKAKKDISSSLKERDEMKHNLAKERDEMNKIAEKSEIEVKKMEDVIRNKDLFYESIIERKDSDSLIFLSSYYSDHYLVQYDISEQYFKTKKHPAYKKAEDIRELKGKCKEYIQQFKIMQYKYEELLFSFPELKEYAEDFESLKELENIKNINQLQQEYDKTKDYLSKEEYKLLTEDERNQLALNRYINGRNKTKWQIGRDYEMYCAHIYRRNSWIVEPFGIDKKLNDMGRDIIAEKGKALHIIQCKYWSSEKLIHEKHIMQLYGSMVEYTIGIESDLIGYNVVPVFITNIELSETAKIFANKLGVTIVNWKIQEFPRIKCNINNGEKIYHLPFDQQYDRTKIENEGEFYAFTIKEATEKGFRRAFKYYGN